MNKWIGSGKVSEDPIIKYDGDKASFIAFTIMVKRNRRIKEGDQPVFYRLHLYRPQCQDRGSISLQGKES